MKKQINLAIRFYLINSLRKRVRYIYIFSRVRGKLKTIKKETELWLHMEVEHHEYFENN